MKIVLSKCGLGLLLLSGAAACGGSSSVDTMNQVVMGVSNITAPSSVSPGQSVSISLDVDIAGCVTLDHISAVRLGASVILTVWGIDHGNLPCAIRTVPDIETYELGPAQSTFMILVTEPAGHDKLSTTVRVQ